MTGMKGVLGAPGAGKISIDFRCECVDVDSVVMLYPRKHDEDIGRWMNKLTLAVGEAHRKLSPSCKVTHMRYVKIPMPKGTEQLGGLPKGD